MIQFNLNQDLANDLVNLPIISSEGNPSSKPLDIEPVQQPGVLGAMVWYAHEVTLDNQKCVIAMEWRSGYVMVFCGLTRHDFNNFEMLFTQRLWREACVITQLEAPLPEEDIAIITGLALELSQHQYFYVQENRQVQNQIYQIKELLQSWMLDEGNTLPVDDDDALHFGLEANEMLRSNNDNDDNVPIEVYKNFWLGFVLHIQGKYSQSSQDLSSFHSDEKMAEKIDEQFDLDGLSIREGIREADSEAIPETGSALNSVLNSEPINVAPKYGKEPASNVIHVDFINKQKV